MRMNVKPMSTALTILNLIAAVPPDLSTIFCFFYDVPACFTGFIGDLAKRRTDFKKGIQIAFLIIFTPPKFALDLIKQKANLFF